jgi:hypothetical protein
MNTSRAGGEQWSSHMRRVVTVAGYVLLKVLGAALFALIFGWLVKLLWNWIMPAILNAGFINYWQAFGVVILAHLIFGTARIHDQVFLRSKDRRNNWNLGGDLYSWLHLLDNFYDFWYEKGNEAFLEYMEHHLKEAKDKEDK